VCTFPHTVTCYVGILLVLVLCISRFQGSCCIQECC
jgi:hypothetical protein